MRGPGLVGFHGLLLACVGIMSVSGMAFGWVTPANIHVPRGEQFTARGADQEPMAAFVGDRGIIVWNDAAGNRSYRKWATSEDGGLTWSYGGDYWVPYPPSDEAGHVRLVTDAARTHYWARLTVDRRVMISKGRWTGSTFAWDPEFVAMSLDGSIWLPEHPWLDIDPASGTLYYTFTHWLDGARTSCAVRFCRSLDGGTNWSAPITLSSDSCTGGRSVVGPDGGVTVIWTDATRDQVLCRRSTDQGATFGPVHALGSWLDNLNTLPPGEAAGRIKNPRWPLAYTYPNWPALAVDRSPGPHRGRLYASWVQQMQGSPGPITVGIGEQEPNNSPSEANPVQIGGSFGGNVLSSDVDRNTTPDYFAFEGQAGQTLMITGWTEYYPEPTGFTPQGIQLFYCGPDTALVELTRVVTTNALDPVPPAIVTLPGTGRYVLKVGGAGPYTVVYSYSLHEYTPSPTSVARDMRDVVLTWSDDGGATWAPLRRISDGPPRYNDCLPNLLVDDRGYVHVAWYDFRDEPACGALAGVYWRMSTDGGATFFPSLRIADSPSSWVSAGANYPIVGDHLALAARGNAIHFMWSDTRDAMATGTSIGTEIYTAQVDVDLVTSTEASVAAFAAWREPGGARLSWRVESPEQVRAFRLHRAGGEGAFEPLAIELPVPTAEPAYEAVDATAAPDRAYRYQLELVLATGGSRWGDVRELAAATPGRLALRAAQPNPFRDRVAMVVASAGREPVEVTVHDLRGARVATLHRGPLPAGESSLEWNGRDAGGRTVAPGMYLVRAQSPRETAVQRVVRVR